MIVSPAPSAARVTTRWLMLTVVGGCLWLGACERKPATPQAQPQAAAPSAMPAANSEPTLTLEQGLAKARARKAALIVDFHAPWCYSCYFMATHVLNGADWDAVRKQAVVVAVDADSPSGSALKQEFHIQFLPSYLVLDADRHELGRILGEHQRAEFYSQLQQILGRGETLTSLQATVRDDTPASLAAGREVLHSYHARDDAEGGLHWLASLPTALRDALDHDAVAALWIARLRFLQAVQHNDPAQILALGAQVLAGDLGCERPYVLDRYLQVAEQQKDAKTLIAAQRAAAEQLVKTGVFGTQDCADQRSAVLALSDIEQALGERDASAALLQQAIADVEAQLGGDLRKDRNLDDNLRVYNDLLAQLSGNYLAYDALMPRLIKAWPDDYVYAARWGKSLLARGKTAEALVQLEIAARQAYGINRLQVAEQRVQALQALKRDAEARRVAAEALKANGPWFADEAAKLKALVQA